MRILGIETSCDETAAAVIETDGEKIKVLSNVVSSQIKIHAPFGGVVPSLAAREHVKNLPHVLTQAMGDFIFDDIDLIAVTAGPGLIPALLIGTTFAKTLAWKYNKPIIAANHIEGHIMSNWLGPIGDVSSLTFSAKGGPASGWPAICLVVSGGHTSLILMSAKGGSAFGGKGFHYQLVGETVDDAAGEAFDKIARILELGYPGGPAISKEAEKMGANGKKIGISLPRPMEKSNDFNFSFAGLKTAVLYQTRELLKNNTLGEIKTEMAHEAQNAIVDVLVSKTIGAAKKYKAKSVMLSGGVSANKKLRERLSQESEKLGVPFFKPELEYTGDNAAMIALAGYLSFRRANSARQNSWQRVKAAANWGIV